MTSGGQNFGMPPDFSKKTIDILAQRAAYLCSNPDCRVSTVGPNTENDQATIIGEAAHIYAARQGQARYNPDMTDQARSEISNAIWLCRNCHRKVDRDAGEYPADLLFIWREQHDEFVAKNLGSAGDLARYKLKKHELSQFDGYPSHIKRIAFDRPAGWEWSLTAALMRHLNAPLVRRLRDIRDGVYKSRIEIVRNEDALRWVSDRMGESLEIVAPFGKILDRFNESWGAPGEPGDIDEIHHATILFKDAFKLVVDYEEKLHSVHISEHLGKALKLIRNSLGSEIHKFLAIPDFLDDVVDRATNGEIEQNAEQPVRIEKVITLRLPDNWNENLERELAIASRAILREMQ